MKIFLGFGLLASILSTTNAVKGGARDDGEVRGLRSHNNGNSESEWYAHLTPNSGSNCPNQAVGVARATLDGSNRRLCYGVLTAGFDSTKTTLRGSNFNNVDLVSNNVDSNSRSCLTLTKQDQRQLQNEDLVIRSQGSGNNRNNCVIQGRLRKDQWHDANGGNDGSCPRETGCNPSSGNRVICNGNNRSNLPSNCRYASLDCAVSAGYSARECNQQNPSPPPRACPEQRSNCQSNPRIPDPVACTSSRRGSSSDCRYPSQDCANTAGFSAQDCRNLPYSCPRVPSGINIILSVDPQVCRSSGLSCEYDNLAAAEAAGWMSWECQRQRGSGRQ